MVMYPPTQRISYQPYPMTGWGQPAVGSSFPQTPQTVAQRTKPAITPTPVTKPISRDVDADEQNDIESAQIEKQQRLARMKRRLFKSEIPISLMAGGLAYLFYKFYNDEAQVTKDLEGLSKFRDKALDKISWIKAEFKGPFGSTLIDADSLPSLTMFNNALKDGLTPAEIEKASVFLKLKNPTNIHVKELTQYTTGYAQRYANMSRNQSGMLKLAMPLFSRRLGMTPERMKDLIRRSPQTFISELLSKALQDKRRNSTYLQQAFSELRRASNKMAGIVAFSVIVGLLGLFVTRYEVAAKREH